jgi:hypothetical protein
VRAAARASTGSQTPWPFLATVEDGDDLETVASQPVGNHVRYARHNQFPRTGDSTRTAQIRQFSETLDSLEQYAGDSIGGRGIVARDGRAKMRQVLDRAEPDEPRIPGDVRTTAEQFVSNRPDCPTR